MNCKYLVVLMVTTYTTFAQQVFKKKALLMGVDFEFSVVANSEKKAEELFKIALSETMRVENLISSWKSSSQTSEVNRMAGIRPVKVDAELLDLIVRSKRISQLTAGYFDISFASLDKLWYFNEPMKVLPDSLAVAKSVAKINYRDILIDKKKSTVFLKKKGMRIGFGSIGKGYVAEKVKQVLIKAKVSAGLVNAGGDLTTWGAHPFTQKWLIQLADPNKVLKNAATFKLMNSAVVTSGNYAKYIEFNGKRYSHIINPKTGWPVTGLKSVSIFCTNTELADALATAVFVMGKERGLALINQLNGIECLLIDDKNELHTSENLKIN